MIKYDYVNKRPSSDPLFALDLLICYGSPGSLRAIHFQIKVFKLRDILFSELIFNYVI